MPNIKAHKPGNFCWIELGTSDQQAAKSFYQQLFGWTSEDMPMGPNEFYTMFKLNGSEVAAGYTLRPGQKQLGVPPHWMLYISVANVDDSTARASQLGATVLVPPFDVFTAGRMSVTQDPTGAVFSMWQPKEHAGIHVTNEEGALCWADLLTRDRDKAADFYSSLFGWTIEKEDENPAHGYYHVKNGDEYIGGLPPMTEMTANVPPHWSIYFQTANCEQKTAQAQSLGATVCVPNMKLENVGTLSVIDDPQGASFCLFQTARQAAAK